MPDLPSPAARLDAARHQFGQMLYRWRKRAGWSGKTPGIWAAEAPDVLPFKVSSATWTGFESGKAKAPAPETFIALELMNRALDSGQVGRGLDPVTRERVAAQKPIRHEDGDLWKAGDFFDCFIGALPAPSDLRPLEYDAEADAARFVRHFEEAMESQGLTRVAGLLAMLRDSGLSSGVASQAERVVTAGGRFATAQASEAAWTALRQWSGS